MSDIRDVIIIGSGPAGYTAGIYTSRAQLEPLLIGGEKNGGQLMNTTDVENWPGSKEGIMGPNLMMDMRAQAEKFGTEIIDKNVTKVDLSGEVKTVWIGNPSAGSEQVEKYQAKTVIIATGAKSRMTGVPGEEKLLGRGVATCAVCDAAFYKEKTTFVIGGGDAAIEDAMALTKFANSVTMLVRSDQMKASKIMQQRAQDHEKITITYNTQIKEVHGEKKVESVTLVDSKTGEEKEAQADGVFIAIGHIPATELFKDQLVLDEHNYLMTGLNGLKYSVTEHEKAEWVKDENKKVSQTDQYDETLWLDGFPTMTSAKGVFAAGDVVDFRYRQAITSAGVGCMAALDAERFLTGHAGGSW